MATTTTTNASASLNPFRSHAVSPQPTGVSSITNQLDNSAVQPTDASGLNEELPPAYTAAPDIQHGETTVQYGPNRPFQPAPAPIVPNLSHQSNQSFLPPPQPAPSISVQSPSSPSHSPGPGSILRQIAETITGALDEVSRPHSHSSRSSWSGYPGLQPQNTGRSVSSSSSYNSNFHRTPPPLPPRSASTSVSPTSEFASDFYAAGTGDDRQLNTESSSPEHLSTQSGTPPASSNAPTTSPTPGRPLLRGGNLLVYPKGFICHKCNNIGYKHADPSHPCRKCWQRYARPFTGPLAYSFSSPTSPSSLDTSRTTFQRPLPSFNSPRHVPAPPHPPAAPHPPQPLFGSAGFSQPYHHQPPSFNRHIHGGGGGGGGLRTLDPYSQPPPGALVYPAGDPRLGGRMCWNCEGRGTVSFFVFDMGSCEVCGGIGRLYH